MASGIYLPTMEELMEATVALAWDAEDHQAALYNATRASAANYNSDTVYAATNEISGTGYTARGEVVEGTAFSRPGAGVMKYSSNAISWPGSTLSGVAHIDVFAAAVDDELMFGVTISPVNTSDGTLLVTPHSDGWVTHDLTPS